MAASDRILAEDLERRDWELVILSVIVITILAVGLALFMFPAVFGQREELQANALQKSFFGFCILILLFNVYLIQRQAALRKLRRQLREEQTRNIALCLQAGQEVLASLPRREGFDDTLAMEFRRSSASNSPSSAMGICIKPGVHLLERDVQGAAYADSAKAIQSKLRKQDSIYYCDEGVFALVLPGLSYEEAQALKQRLQETLGDVSGVTERFQYEVRSATYPHDAASMHEIKALIAIK